MNRRTFTVVTSLAGFGVLNHWALVSCGPEEGDLRLAVPETLIAICDPRAIMEIGSAYRQMVPAENDRSVLAGLLASGLEEYTADGSKLLQNRIQNEYRQNDILEVEGWLISVTEARQCALYSLLKS